MSGLDKMKSRIYEEAEQSAAQILDQAKKDADKIIKEAVDEAGAEAEHIRARAKAHAEEQEKRAKSSVEMNRKQALLAAKQEVIQTTLDAAYEKVMKQDDEAYFEMLVKLLEKYVLAQDGEICFSGKDLARMPKTFAEKISAAAKAKGGTLVISEETRPIEGGFILVYGGIEENCTIKAVFEAKREELADEVKKLLFS